MPDVVVPLKALGFRRLNYRRTLKSYMVFNRIRNLLKCHFVVVIIFLAGGCSVFDRDAKYVFFGKADDKANQKKIAVLPFQNISDWSGAGKFVSDAYVTELFNGGKYRVEEPGNIRQFYRQERLVSQGEIELEELRILGKRLRLDGVIVGTVLEFRDDLRKTPVVALSARMLDPASGRIVWAMERKRQGDEYIIIFDFGEVRTAANLAHKVVREMLSTLEW